MAIEKLERHKSPGIDQIPAELIKAGGINVCSEIHKIINSIWNKEELPEQWKDSIIVPIYEKGDKTNCGNYQGILLLSIHTKFYQGCPLLIIYSAFVKYLRKERNTSLMFRLQESL
jgi:hypothetical protein